MQTKSKGWKKQMKINSKLRRIEQEEKMERMPKRTQEEEMENFDWAWKYLTLFLVVCGIIKVIVSLF